VTQLLQSYLFAYLFWLAIALGSFAWLAIHGLTGGQWGETIRGPLLAAAGTIPLFAILFLPLLFGVKLLFPWTGSAAPEVAAKAAYLNVPFFALRAAIYFACWSALALVTVRRKSVPLPGPSLVLYAVTMTFAAWDWMMSLEPRWWSTIYAMNVLSGQALAALAAVVVVVLFGTAGVPPAVRDLGNLLLAAVMFRAYLTFSQFLVIWSGNGKEEIAWYLPRIETSWKWLAAALIVFAFFAPFLVLLFRSAKRSATVLAGVAALLLAMEAVALFWTLAPAFHPHGLYVSWLDVVAFVAIGALWLRVFRYQLLQGV
jgi:hypothetical protein